MDLTEKQKEILRLRGHILVTGGPGSGKTTVAILKAALRLERQSSLYLEEYSRSTAEEKIT